MAKVSGKVSYILLIILVIAGFLRLWRLGEVPVSLFGDELDVGYHAYSILKTGRDYSGNFMPLHFQSLAEWRTPLYLYSSVPTVALFGISPLGVRLPAVLFGILGVWLLYLVVRQFTKSRAVSLLSAGLLATSPWHIQYSRAGFEVTEMLAFYLAGIYFFLRGLKDGRWLAPAAVFLALTPWVYSTAKLFLPLTALALLVIWWRDLAKIPRKYLVWAAIAFFVVVAPITWSTLVGGGTARFSYISVFTDPTTAPEVGFARLRDARMRGELGAGVRPTTLDSAAHNKLTWWASALSRNYLQSFSTQFLFINGDLNPRHSPPGIGQFFKAEALFMLLGAVFLLTRPLDKRSLVASRLRKIKLFLVFWLLAAPLPAALTRDGGMHATRLFFFLPPLVFLVALGIYGSWERVRKQWRSLFVTGVALLYLFSFLFYQHNFWVHYPWDSERWWHAGFRDAVRTAVREGEKYDKVIISMAGEPALIFFLGWSEYPPEQLHEEPLSMENLVPFGEIPKLDKYYFGTLSAASLEELAEVLPENLLYVANAREVGKNLILEPEKKPAQLDLVRVVTYPSGEPAFYLLARK